MAKKRIFLVTRRAGQVGGQVAQKFLAQGWIGNEVQAGAGACWNNLMARIREGAERRSPRIPERLKVVVSMEL